MKQFVQDRLAILARAIIRKYKPIVIVITGSVGKTSARDAIFSVVRQKYHARKADKNYNNEIGLPLTILGSPSPYRNPLAWLALFAKGYSMLWFRGAYPQVLILEMGVDHPGDMDKLLAIAKPHISVLTNIGISHYEFFKNDEAVVEEKRKLIQRLNSADFAILNADNPKVMAQEAITKAQVITYGTEQADIMVSVIGEQLSAPAYTRLQVKGQLQFIADVPAVGRPHVSACSAAIAVASSLDMEPELIKKGLRDYRSAPGRLNLISGIKKTLILEDSYNASPDSMKEALAVLARMPNPHKVAVLGDMLELGDLTEETHMALGAQVAKLNLDMLVTVGERGQIIADGAEQAGMPAGRIHAFLTSEDAREFVLQNLIEDSAILVKGSQGVRMERVSKEILANPMSAHDVLPRQYDKWLE